MAKIELGNDGVLAEPYQIIDIVLEVANRIIPRYEDDPEILEAIKLFANELNGEFIRIQKEDL